jgi:hypothetical protein
MPSDRQRPIINLDEVEPAPATEHGDRFKAPHRAFEPAARREAARVQRKRSSTPASAPSLSTTTKSTRSSSSSWPAPARCALATRSIRCARATSSPVPPGGPEVAHQLINTGTEALRYLAASTTIDTDVFQYPVSGKFGVVAGRQPGQRPHEAPFAGFYRESEKLDYWDGE